MKNSIFFKSLTGHVIIIVVSVLFTTGYFLHTVEKHRVSEERAHLRHDALIYARLATALLAQNSGAGLDSIATASVNWPRESDEQLAWFDLGGKRLSAVDNWSETARQSIFGKIMADSTVVLYTSEADRQVVGTRVVVQGQPVGALLLIQAAGSGQKLIWVLKRDIITFALILAALALLLAYVFSRSLTDPIRALAQAATSVGEGDYRLHPIPHNTREINQLAEAITTMTERLGKVVGSLDRRHSEIAGVISAINEPLFVLNDESRIKLYNEACQVFLTPDCGQYSMYWQAITDPDINEFVKASLKEDTPRTSQITAANRSWLCSSARVEFTGATVFLFNDITAIKELEKNKRDLVSNVSHELRTPLTSILGYVEILQDEANPEQKKLLDIILRNTQRLNAIINDLLTLSSVESQRTLDLQPLQAHQMLEQSVLVVKPKAEAKHLIINLSCADDIFLKGDPFRLDQVLVNLLENAVRYTDEGRVDISCVGLGNQVCIAVSDTGVGIPPEAQAHLFDRFYVVDKSRSRRSGGTGLGLSIVKHIVMQHGGRIEVTSEPGQGSTFAVYLPRA